MKLSKEHLDKTIILSSSYCNGSAADSCASPFILFSWLSAGDVAVNGCSQYIKRTREDG